MADQFRDHQDTAPVAKKWIIGEALPNGTLDGQLLRKRMALPIFASDALSSVAYAPQELIMILMIGGLGFLVFAPWVAAAVVALLLVVVLSYRQLIKAYPSGGGDYEVAHRNLGRLPGVIVASALLVDYVLTVAVSVASGVDNIISALPELNPWRVELAVGFVLLIIVVNLRGVREASLVFAIPTYLFIASIVAMIVIGLARTAMGDPPVASSADYTFTGEQLTQVGAILLVLRAFSSGCSALTGVEAVSNGVPAFRRPKIDNARTTLAIMGTVAAALFCGLVALALIANVHYAEHPCDLQGFDCTGPQPSLIAQLSAATFGSGSVLFYVVQAATACVLLLAANTAFNGFPLLGAVLAKDGYAPKSLRNRGDRLVYSNGLAVLGGGAIVILIAFQANLTVLIQLYIIGVFVSFSIGQVGMVRHWQRVLRSTLNDTERREARKGLIINGVGAVVTCAVFSIVTLTKFTHGAWLVFLAIPLLSLLMLGIRRYYATVDQEIALDDTTRFGAHGDLAIVLVSRVQKPTVKALDYALAARHEHTIAVHVAADDDEAAEHAVRSAWERLHVPVELVVLQSPFRSYGTPIADYIEEYRRLHGASVVTVYLPQFVVGRWWENLLHNRRARRIAQRLMLVHGVSVTLVPWRLESSELLSRPLRPQAGQERAGVPAPTAGHHRVHRPEGPPEA